MLQIFDTRPPQQIGAPCPPKPSHSLVNVMPPANDGATTSKQSSASLSAVSDVSESQQSSLDDGSSLAVRSRSVAASFVPTHPISSSVSTGTGSAFTTVRQRQPPPQPPSRSNLAQDSNSTEGKAYRGCCGSNVCCFSELSSASASSLCPPYSTASTSTVHTAVSAAQPHPPRRNAGFNSSPRTANNSSDSLNSVGSDRSPTSTYPHSTHSGGSGSSSYVKGRVKVIGSRLACLFREDEYVIRATVQPARL